MIKDMRYIAEDVCSHLAEFWNILHPAGFFVYNADKLDKEGADMYIIRVGRISPKVHSEGISDGDSPPACPDVSYCEDALNRRNRES